MLTFAVQILLVIPARIGSTRLPSKPLCRLAGEPLVAHTVRNALEYPLGASLVVATDDRRIMDAVAPLGVTAVLTKRSHRSGTERVAEVACRPEFSGSHVIVNLQCDEPCFPGSALRDAVRRVSDGEPIVTFGCSLEGGAQTDRNRVKMAVDGGGRALWFSRDRQRLPNRQEDGGAIRVLQHLGCYVYTRAALLEWVNLPPVSEERRERLEQLRPLLQGIPIGTVALSGPAPPTIDTPEDLARVASHLAFSGG